MSYSQCPEKLDVRNAKPECQNARCQNAKSMHASPHEAVDACQVEGWQEGLHHRNPIVFLWENKENIDTNIFQPMMERYPKIRMVTVMVDPIVDGFKIYKHVFMT